MRIIIGGAYQGKIEYAIRCLQEQLDHKPTEQDIKEKTELNLHLIIKRMLNNENPGKVVERIVLETTKKKELNPELIITCDEVGLGIVPMERKERDYRECVGRVLQELVKLADQVDRVVAGIPVRIK